MKVVKPSANGLNHNGQKGLKDSHLQQGHKPLGSAQVKAIAAKASKPKPAPEAADNEPDADDMPYPY